MAVPTGRESDKFVLRLPDGMRDRIKAEADANGRSMNAEIVSAIEFYLGYEESMLFGKSDARHIAAAQLAAANQAFEHARIELRAIEEAVAAASGSDQSVLNAMLSVARHRLDQLAKDKHRAEYDMASQAR